MTDQEMQYIECAKINLANLAMLVPGLKDAPLFKIVEQQLKWATDGSEDE